MSGWPYSWLMHKTPVTEWKFQTSDETAIHRGNPTDARGLRLRAQCGYSHVHMGDASGWLQLSVAIRKVELAERMAALAA